MTAEDGTDRPEGKVVALDALVIGAGPAGLMAAEELARAGRDVVLAEAKPSAGRKFLMAGKSGLNLTKDAPVDAFVAAYGDAADWLRPMLEEMGPEAVKTWAEGLGQPLFTGSSGRVFPEAMKASPLLRAWLGRIPATLRLGWRWTGWLGDAWRFETPEGPCFLAPRVVVLALGGASWRRLGSDGAWADWMAERGIEIAPFKPANMGFVVEWSDHMRPHFGAPVKAIRLITGEKSVRGEAVISARGIEGGGVYAVSAAVRDGAEFAFDLTPDLSKGEVAARLAKKPRKQTLSRYLGKALGLDPVKRALLQEWGRPLPQEQELARLIKHLPVRHQGPRPIDEAISTAGGIRETDVDDTLMMRAMPGVFVAGEMLDWEAPTGGYLITGCLATGRWAGLHAARWHG
ncbi:NAD(FAD)-utilizing dehydrogenase [Roseibacterium elongatum DSM 19469]|uniref:NAD(FAD)-utilizing dehydrogenase n=1 Tax=Roseicyclus elongatus DSM 19469 TaxID=1294273 RepID=W8RZG0_9RHOB|nr:TIGR03862 family flavoprotein [Roseibacterium elongatum]AHM03267.1 NAD(FAD)-utilizing dehydrogenase [Roseibacterium elongatum DSM 19469]